jgi:hypothetical protein
MQIKIGTFAFETPDSWNDLNINQLYPIYFLLKADGLEPIVRLSELTKLLLNIGDEFIDKWKEATLEKHGVIDGDAIWSEDWSKVVSAVTYPFISPIEGAETFKYQISMSLTRCPAPELKLPNLSHSTSGKTFKGERKFIACADAFKNITIGEFARIDALVQRFQNTGDAQHILECLAVIYRPTKEFSKKDHKANYHGDKRMPLKDAAFSIPMRTRMMSHIKSEWRHLLWFWIVSCREQIMTQWKSVLNPDTAQAQSFWDKKLAQFQWTGLFIEMANSSGQTEQAISEMPFSDVFVKLSYLETKRKAEKK